MASEGEGEIVQTDEIGGDSKTFFLKHGNETKKVTGPTHDRESLLRILKDKFGADSVKGSIAFWVEDREYHVNHKIDDFNEIYDGAIVEARVGSDLKRELEEMKRKIEEMEESESPGGKRQRRERAREVKDDGKHVVRLRGLPWSCSTSDILDFFKGLNIQGGEEGILCALNAGGRSTGEAFVQFQTEEDVEAALRKDHSHIGRRYIEVYRSNEEEKERAVSKSKPWSVVSSESIVIRMRGLPFSANEEEVKAFFEGLDPVGVHIVNDSLGRPSGDAYVEFSSEDASSKAMGFQKKTMGSRYIELFRSSVGELTSAVTKPPTAYISRSGSNERESGYRGRDRGGYSGDLNSAVLRMQGIPFSATEADITRFFQDAGVTPIRIHRKHNGGEAYVEFNNPGDARQAMSLHKSHIGRRYIELFRCSYQEMAEIVGLPMPRGGGGGGYDRDFRDSYRGGGGGGFDRFGGGRRGGRDRF